MGRHPTANLCPSPPGATASIDVAVDAALEGVADQRHHARARSYLQLLAKVTGHTPRACSPGLVRVGDNLYRFDAGAHPQWVLAAVSYASD